MKRSPAILVALFVAGLALADGNDPTTNPQATPVAIYSQQATTNCVHNAAAAGAQATATVNACGPGLFFYVTLVESTYSAIAAPAATLMATTTTNFTTSFGASQAMQAAVGENSRIWTFAVPLKTAAANTATTVVGNAGVTSISENVKLCGFCAK